MEQLKQYIPFNEQERKDKEMILSLFEQYDNLYNRENGFAHVTTSAWVVNKQKTKVLMAYHNIYDSWAWLGGHNDGNPNCLEVAIKEVKEESGLEDVKVLDSSIFSVEVLGVEGHVKHGQYVSSHLHLNVTYLLEADENQVIRNKVDENQAVAWFELDEAIEKCTEPWFKENIYNKLNKKLRESYC